MSTRQVALIRHMAIKIVNIAQEIQVYTEAYLLYTNTTSYSDHYISTDATHTLVIGYDETY